MNPTKDVSAELIGLLGTLTLESAAQPSQTSNVEYSNFQNLAVCENNDVRMNYDDSSSRHIDMAPRTQTQVREKRNCTFAEHFNSKNIG